MSVRKMHGPRSLKEDTGLCLMELLCALGIGTIVAVLTFDVLSRLEGRFRLQHRDMAFLQDARLGLAVWEQEVRAIVDRVGEGVPAIHRATTSDVEFDANVNGLETTLASPGLPGQTDLAVLDGSGWPEGKRVRLCHRTRCFEYRLARDGQRSTLTLASPLLESIPAGAEIFVVNQVRYYVVESAPLTYKLMRQIDGGANPLIADLRAAGFEFRTRTGVPTNDPNQIATVRIDLGVGSDGRSVTQDVAVRM